LRINIVDSDINIGNVFELLENYKEELNIDYYTMTNAKMELIFRNIVEDEKNNSQHSCNILFNDDIYNNYQSKILYDKNNFNSPNVINNSIEIEINDKSQNDNKNTQNTQNNKNNKNNQSNNKSKRK